jgi:hypothetical protein
MPPGAGWRYRAGVEAFRVVCGHCFGSRGFVVSGSVKFPVRLKINPVAGPKEKTHGFEVDLVGARADGLVLASVKSFFGSGGVVAEHVTGATANVRARKLYRLLNDVTIREKVIAGAAERYGYQQSQVQLRFYVGGFAGPVQGTDKAKVEQWCSEQHAGAGPIAVYGVGDVVERVLRAATAKQYRDNRVLVAMKVLQAAGRITLPLPEDIGAGLAPEALGEEP